MKRRDFALGLGASTLGGMLVGAQGLAGQPTPALEGWTGMTFHHFRSNRAALDVAEMEAEWTGKPFDEMMRLEPNLDSILVLRNMYEGENAAGAELITICNMLGRQPGLGKANPAATREKLLGKRTYELLSANRNSLDHSTTHIHCRRIASTDSKAVVAGDCARLDRHKLLHLSTQAEHTALERSNRAVRNLQVKLGKMKRWNAYTVATSYGKEMPFHSVTISIHKDEEAAINAFYSIEEAIKSSLPGFDVAAVNKRLAELQRLSRGSYYRVVAARQQT